MAETFSQHYIQNVERFSAEKVAVRQKELGIWQEYTWQQSYEQVRLIGLGLIVLGMQRGEHIAGISDNDRHYLWSYIGALSIGGAFVGLYTDASPDESAYIIDHADAKYVLAQDQEQVDKMLEIRDKIPQVRRVIYWEDNGLWNYNDPWLISLEELSALGAQLLQREPSRFETEIKIGRSGDLAIISYTSGTTGVPKGAMLTHFSLLEASRLFDQIDPRLDTDNHVSFLPIGWIAENVLGIATHCAFGLIINFPEKPETVRQNIREIAPETVVYQFRLWDALVSSIQVRMLDATWPNRLLYKLFMPIGYRAAEETLSGARSGIGLRLLNKLGDLLFFAPLRDSLGLSNVRTAITGGAVLSPDVIRFFHAIGINLNQVYGATETAATGAAHRVGDIKYASVGKPVPGVNIKVGDDGEIRIASPSMFEGYYKADNKSAEVIRVDENGKRWFLTGDAGYIDEDGHLIYLDRLKDMIELSHGDRFSPQFIEGRLKFSPYIKDVMAIGDPTRDFVTALIIIEFDNVARWAEKRGLGFTTMADLSQKQPVIALVSNAVREVNANLPSGGRVRAFVLMPREFDADEAEMTRSRKLKRKVLLDKYDTLVAALYSDAKTVGLQSTITYQDGTVATVENELVVVRIL
ncbi:MAG: AMP-binding protein [Anaerolineae bacterium]|nr:AMP-binding protein [Anaerolineae bacterium]